MRVIFAANNGPFGRFARPARAAMPPSSRLYAPAMTDGGGPSRIPMNDLASSSQSMTGRPDMTLFYSHHDRLHNAAGTRRFTIKRAFKRAGAALRMMHRAIAAAKIHRLRNELMFHSGAY